MNYIEDTQLDEYAVRVEGRFSYGSMTATCDISASLFGTKETLAKLTVENLVKKLQNSELYHRLSRDSQTGELKCYVGSEIYRIVTKPKLLTPKIELRSKTPGKVSTGRNSELLIDGQPLNGVTSVSINVDGHGLARVKVELIGNIEASGIFEDVTIERK